ncbi:scab [Carabus blaptoides fortunei]
MFYKVACFYYLCSYVFAFNFFPRHTEVFSNNNSDSYFGYSVLLQASLPGNPARIIVGAPRANSSYTNLHNDILQPGAVYACSFNHESCEQFLFDSNGNTLIKEPNGMSYHHKKEHSWLGAAIDGEDLIGGLIVVCAPRWINQIRKSEYYQNGICYLKKNSTNIRTKPEELIPLLFPRNQAFRVNSVFVYYYGVGQAGMSVHLTKNYTEILIGAPGILQWTGMVIKYSGTDATTETISKKSNLMNMNYDKQDIPNPYYIHAIKDFSYFGYASSSGKFQNNKIWYVGGAPRGNRLYGQVLVYEYIPNKDDIKIHFGMTGRQQGEYFGASLGVGDLNDDGADDIIVGSPMFSTSRGVDVGCIYVFMNNGRGKFTRTIVNGPEQSLARFGTAISVIGDINKDNFADVVIGAPYYNNRQGAIFIYMGSKSGITEEYSQMILASEVDESLRGFGISFSRGVDIDHNYYNDLAVGAYLSGHVVVLKTRPVVSISSTLVSDNQQIFIDTRSFNVSACINYKGVHVPSMLHVKLNIVVDKFYMRTYFSKNHGAIWKVTKQFAYNTVICEIMEITVTRQQTNFTQPIVIEMIHELVDGFNNDTFCSTCPIVDKRASNLTLLNIPFKTNCGDDSICQPQLKISAQFNYDKPALVIGSTDKLAFSVQIENSGEHAFLSRFFAGIPSTVSFDKIPNNCEEVEDNILLCDLENPIYAKETTSLILNLDVSMLENKDPFRIHMNVSSVGIEEDLKDNYFTLELPLESKADVSIIGLSELDQTLTNENTWFKKLFLPISHQYIIQNIGPSILDDLVLNFLIPHKLGESNDELIKIIKTDLTIADNSLVCKTMDEEDFHVDKKEAEVRENEESELSQVQSKSTRSVPELESYNSITSLHLKMQKILASDYEIPPTISNKTLSLSCISPELDVKCINVRCVTGPLKKMQPGIVVNFHLMVNLTYLYNISKHNDTIVITSSVRPESNYTNTNITFIHSILPVNSKSQDVLKWIIIACILGLLLLCAKVFGLYKAGFFKRIHHERLLREKHEANNMGGSEMRNADE